MTNTPETIILTFKRVRDLIAVLDEVDDLLNLVAHRGRVATSVCRHSAVCRNGKPEQVTAIRAQVATASDSLRAYLGAHPGGMPDSSQKWGAWTSCEDSK